MQSLNFKLMTRWGVQELQLQCSSTNSLSLIKVKRLDCIYHLRKAFDHRAMFPRSCVAHALSCREGYASRYALREYNEDLIASAASLFASRGCGWNIYQENGVTCNSFWSSCSHSGRSSSLSIPSSFISRSRSSGFNKDESNASEANSAVGCTDANISQQKSYYTESLLFRLERSQLRCCGYVQQTSQNRRATKC